MGTSPCHWLVSVSAHRYLECLGTRLELDAQPKWANAVCMHEHTGLKNFTMPPSDISIAMAPSRCRILEGWHEPLQAYISYMMTQSTNVEFSISCQMVFPYCIGRCRTLRISECFPHCSLSIMHRLCLVWARTWAIQPFLYSGRPCSTTRRCRFYASLET